MNKNKSFRVSEEFDKKLHCIQKYYKGELGLDYTIADILDEMLDLYERRIMHHENILNEMLKANSQNLLNKYLENNMKMLDAITKIVIDSMDDSSEI